MTLNAYKFGLASAISFSVIWLVCSLLVWLFPKMTMGIAGEMLHADMTSEAVPLIRTVKAVS